MVILMAKIWRNQGETESTTVTAQDQAINTNYFKIKFLKKKLTVSGGYVNNMKKLWTTCSQDAPFWQRMNT